MTLKKTTLKMTTNLQNNLTVRNDLAEKYKISLGAIYRVGFYDDGLSCLDLLVAEEFGIKQIFESLSPLKIEDNWIPSSAIVIPFMIVRENDYSAGETDWIFVMRLGRSKKTQKATVVELADFISNTKRLDKKR